MATFSDLRNRTNRAESERGAILVLTALVILLLLFIAAFSTDLGAWYRQTEEQQRAADVSSLNGVSSYDRAVKEYLDSKGASTWQDLSLAQRGEAEEAGVEEALISIIGLLETSGLDFTGATYTRDIIGAAPGDMRDPLDPSLASVVTITLSDGTVITVSREMVETDQDASGNPIYSRVINVGIARPGEQYFSNILRDAPTIERTAQSIISNCGATCNNEVVFNPPFVGFDAPGNGDGHTPLLLDTTFNGIPDEVWAVNHHASGTPISNTETFGSIICYGVESKQPCEAAHFDLLYATNTTPIEYLHTENDAYFGRLYFAGVDQKLPANPVMSGDPNWKATDPNTADNEAGIVCFDTQSRSYCPTPFVAVDSWGMDSQVNWGSWINLNGPFRVDDRLYVFSQDGQGACFNLDMTPCAVSGAQDLGLANAGSLRPIDHDQKLGLNGLQFETPAGRDRIAYFQTAVGGTVVACIDVDSANGQITSCGDYFWNTSGNDGKTVPFERYNHSQQLIGICSFAVDLETSFCLDMNGNSAGAVPGMDAAAFNGDLGNTFVYSDSLTWEGKRTFIATGGNDLILCWNWTLGNNGDGAACTDGPDRGGSALDADLDFLVNELNIPASSSRQGEGIETYAFAQVSEGCVIALGDEAIFFSFNPEGFGPCIDAKLTTPIVPCDCQDANQGKRWGAITVPQGLLNDVVTIEATIVLPDGSIYQIDGSPTVDLLATSGVIDLSGLNDLASPPAQVDLELRVNSKLDGNGDPLFADPYETNLEISVQPTLTE